MLATPAHAGLGRQFDFHDGRAVGEHPVPKRRDLGDAIAQVLQPAAQHLVIVAAERVARNVRATAVRQDVPTVGDLRGKIIHPDADDAHGARHEFRRPCAPCAVRRQVIHVALPSARQPFLQARLRLAKVAIGNANLLKTQFRSPLANSPNEPGRITGGRFRLQRFQLDRAARKSSFRVSPCFIRKKCSGSTPLRSSATASLRGGSSSNSSVRRKVPQCIATA